MQQCPSTHVRCLRRGHYELALMLTPGIDSRRPSPNSPSLSDRGANPRLSLFALRQRNSAGARHAGTAISRWGYRCRRERTLPHGVYLIPGPIVQKIRRDGGHST